MVGSEYLKRVFSFWKYRKGDSNSTLEKELLKMYGAKRVYLFSNARSAEYIFLKSLDLSLDSEVIIQAFTCNAVVNPILWLKHTPVYADISSKTYCMDFNSLKENFTSRTEAVIVQHTFGIDGYSEPMYEFLKSKGVYVLEDCAHSIGNSRLGSKGDAAIVSFGIEKVLSTRVGGALLVNNEDLISKIDREYKKIKELSTIETFLWMINPLIWRVLRKLGALQKVVSYILNRVGLLNMGFVSSELKGIKPGIYPRRLPDVLSWVVLNRMRTIEENLEHRRYINDLYASALDVPHLKGVSSVRFPMIVEDVRVLETLKKALSDNDIYYGDWYSPLIYPGRTNIESMGYRWGDCPVAQEVSRHIINLPTGFSTSKKDALDISNVIKKVLKGR